MTDITELAQKRSAAISQLSGAFDPGHINQRELDALSYAVDVMNELVEALEKAQRANGYLREQSAEWERKAISNFQECAKMSERIYLLESRAVTAKPPKQPSGLAYASVAIKARDEQWYAALTAAGIKWEAE